MIAALPTQADRDADQVAARLREVQAEAAHRRYRAVMILTVEHDGTIARAFHAPNTVEMIGRLTVAAREL